MAVRWQGRQDVAEDNVTGVDRLGFNASGLVLATFCMKRLVPLRVLAIKKERPKYPEKSLPDNNS